MKIANGQPQHKGIVLTPAAQIWSALAIASTTNPKSPTSRRPHDEYPRFCKVKILRKHGERAELRRDRAREGGATEDKVLRERGERAELRRDRAREGGLAEEKALRKRGERAELRRDRAREGGAHGHRR